MTSKTSYEVTDGVAVLRLDDGKANAVGHETLAAIEAALDDAEQGAGALVITGREGRFSAGFDLRVFDEGPEAAQELAASGARTATRLYGAQIPVVAACNGHALAFGAILLLCSDGLHGVTSHEVIASTLDRDGSLQDKAQWLIDATLGLGAPDNVTVVLVRHAGAAR